VIVTSTADEDDHQASSVTRRLHFYKGVCGHHWTTVEDQLRINHAMEMEHTTSCCRRVPGDGPILVDGYTNMVHVISLPDS